MSINLGLFLFLLVSLELGASVDFEANLEIGTGTHSNIFYSEKTAESASLNQFRADMDFDYESKYFYSDLKLDAQQNNFSDYEKANHLENNAGFSVGAGRKELPWFEVFAETATDSNPLMSASSNEFLEFTELKMGVRTGFRFGEKSSLELTLSTTDSSVNSTEYRYLNHIIQNGRLVYSYQFLPETKIYLALESGDTKYKDGSVFIDADSSDGRVKYDHDLQMIMAGVQGRLTKYTKIDAGFGFKNMDYKKEKSFGEPIFYVDFTDQISPKDALLAGYLYRVKDSSFTNWVLEQDMSIGYSRILKDTFLFQMRLSYIYYSYSEPFRREDQRLLAKFRIDYVFAPRWSLVTRLNGDLLVSDAYDTDTTASDRSASFTATDLSLSIRRSF